MCDPVSLAVTALVAGTGLQMKAQSDRNSDMRKLTRREGERQDKYYADSKKYLDENQGTYERSKVDANMADAAAARQAEYAAADRNAPRANEALPGAGSNNVVVMDAFRRALQGAAQGAQQQGAARAELASFGDTMGQNAIDTGRNSGYIGMNGSFAQGSSNVLPFELNYAATRQRGAATLGNLLTTIGGAVLTGGAGGLFGGGSGAAGAFSSGVGSGVASGAAGGLGGLNSLVKSGSSIGKGAAGMFSGLGG